MEKITVNCVAVARVTVPTAPLLKITLLLPGIRSKPVPFMVIVVTFIDNRFELLVIAGKVVRVTSLPLPPT